MSWPFILDGAILQDRRLSLEAVGFLVRALSTKEDFNSSQFRERIGVGSEDAHRIISELIGYGYIRLSKEYMDGGTTDVYEITSRPGNFDSQPEDYSFFGPSSEPVENKCARRSFSKEKRQKVFSKTNGFCWYCGCRITLRTVQPDHIIPYSKGGTDDISNLVPTCKACNSAKRDFSLDQFRRQRSVRHMASSLIGLSHSEKKVILDSLNENAGSLLDEQAQSYLFWFEKQGLHEVWQ